MRHPKHYSIDVACCSKSDVCEWVGIWVGMRLAVMKCVCGVNVAPTLDNRKKMFRKWFTTKLFFPGRFRLPSWRQQENSGMPLLQPRSKSDLDLWIGEAWAAVRLAQRAFAGVLWRDNQLETAGSSNARWKACTALQWATNDQNGVGRFTRASRATPEKGSKKTKENIYQVDGDSASEKGLMEAAAHQPNHQPVMSSLAFWDPLSPEMLKNYAPLVSFVKKAACQSTTELNHWSHLEHATNFIVGFFLAAPRRS